MNGFPVFDEELNMLPNDQYKEILVLDKMLTEAGIPHTLWRNLDGWSVVYPPDSLEEVFLLSAIEHFGSYGSRFDRIEIMWRGDNNVTGYLTAQEVFEQIKAHYDNVGS